MAAFLKAEGVRGRALKRELAELCLGDDRETEPTLLGAGPAREADLAWLVRAWGRRVLAGARRRLASRYPTYAAFQALKPGGRPFEPRPMTLLTPDARGDTDVDGLNAELDAVYLKDPHNPRWVAKPAVAYLWARTARCKGCRATVPLLKTRWLARKGAKRVRLTMTANAEKTGVAFGVELDVPRGEANAARRREHDRRGGAGTMSRSGARCPLCQAIMTMQDLRLEGRAGRLDEVMTAVVVDGPRGKEYRLPTALELEAARVDAAEIDAAFETPLGPKWNAAANDGELIDDAARFGGDRNASKRNYEEGMARAFSRFHAALRDDGRLVIVFANKSPDAWETLVSALIRAGFVVVGSWPIQTERLARTRAMQSAALASSIWIVCRKRPAARAGWDATVLDEMRENITQQLRDFWTAGIRGPDFVWAATGPALEAFSKHPVVKKADAPGRQLTVRSWNPCRTTSPPAAASHRRASRRCGNPQRNRDPTHGLPRARHASFRSYP